ncbi:MAG TPA: phage tail protein [Gemmatimonadaceae bacterium]|nr:phage tail protein [Gemmatimonadaceae bacterium]
MTAQRQRSYRFATGAQWATCLAERADGERLRAGGVRPTAGYARAGVLHAARGSHAPSVTRAGEVLWVDAESALHRLLPLDDETTVIPAPSTLARATRIVSTPAGLWVIGPDRDTLQCFDDETLTRRLVAELPSGRAVDIAGDGRDAVFVLIEDASALAVLRVDRNGRVVHRLNLSGVSHATAFVFLSESQRLVVLVGEHHQRLVWFTMGEEKPLFGVTVATLRPCFVARSLGSDARGRIALAGEDGMPCGRGGHVLVLDADANVVGEVPLDSLDVAATGVVATKRALFVTGPRGMKEFGVSDVVPNGSEPARCTMVTPMLYSPDREDHRRWLRVEASASVPEGCTIELSFAAADDAETRERLNAIATNVALPMSQRVNRLLAEPDVWRGRTVYTGGSSADEASAVYSAKLFDVRERYLWVSVTLTAAPGARLPELSELRVLYPGLTLMENLPAIYRRDEAEPNSFLRDLVGVLETTTQELDARIATLGAHVHPSTAPVEWLDYLARWLGLPWDDALAETRKRAIVTRAEELTETRGTRLGLEALLDCLLPGMPRRFRVTDSTADAGFAVVGGASCTGSALPAMLGGQTRWSAELDASAVLGYMRLPCAAQRDDGAWQLAGVVRVEVVATRAERDAWAPWFRALLTEMIPLTARLDLRWVSAGALRADVLDGHYILTSAPAPHLGVDAVTELARLPERGTRLSASGSNVSTRLR